MATSYDLYYAMRLACGYIENGTNNEVTIFQDETSKVWTMKINDGSRIKTFTADTFPKLLLNVLDVLEREEDEQKAR